MAALEIVALDTVTPQLRAPGTGDTYLAPRALALTPETLTGSAATSGLSLTQTWNTTGTPTALDITVTDTASNAASRLMRFTSGGIERLVLTKTGILHGAGASSGSFIVGSKTQFRPGSISIGAQVGAFSTGSVTGGGIFCSDDSGGTQVAGWSNRGFMLSSSSVLGWSATTIATNADVELHRDAANTLALRNGVNAQALNLYNTWTDASNYERLVVKYASNIARIGFEAAGTGTGRNTIIGNIGNNSLTSTLVIDPGYDGTTGGTKTLQLSVHNTRYFEVNGIGGHCTVGTTSGSGRPLRLASNTAGVSVLTNFMEFDEMTAPSAPAANKARLYFADSGGKTAAYIIFPSGAAQQIAIEP